MDDGMTDTDDAETDTETAALEQAQLQHTSPGDFRRLFDLLALVTHAGSLCAKDKSRYQTKKAREDALLERERRITLEALNFGLC